MIVLIVIPNILGKILPVLGIDAHLIYSSQIVRFLSIFLIFTLAISWMYKIIPNIKLKLIEVLPGALISTSLILSGASIISYYIHNFPQASVIYGSILGMIASLLFFYIINLFLIFGAEFNYHLQNEK
jgi:membrane protein